MAIHEESTNTLWVANVGDSRGVLSCGEEVIPLSYDHKPSQVSEVKVFIDPFCSHNVFQIKERKRIEEAGGFVAMNGVWRVQGILATSRALGDFPLKNKKVVTSEPDILSFDTTKLNADFAILASDGLWDTHTNDEAAVMVKSSLSKVSDIQQAAETVALDSYKKGSTDNVTVLVIKFS